MKIKIFQGYSSAIEKEINEWLKDKKLANIRSWQQSEISIRQRTGYDYEYPDDHTTITFLYKETEGEENEATEIFFQRNKRRRLGLGLVRHQRGNGGVRYKRT